MWLRTREESRALALLDAVGESLELPVHTWSCVRGCDDEGVRRPLSLLLDELLAARGPALWVLLDPAAQLRDPAVLRGLRELSLRTEGPAVVVVSPSAPAMIPEMIELRLPLPDAELLRHSAHRIARQQEARGQQGSCALVDEVAPALARLGLGLDLHRYERLLREALLSHDTDGVHSPGGASLLAYVAEHKPDALGESALLEWIEPAAPELLGGLHELKRWLSRRALAIDPKARGAGIPDPRGVLLVGVQGCGKSLAARVCASLLGLPIARLDPGRLFAGTVGASEANLRDLTELAERLAPLVLWIDEIDKGLAGADGAASDGGTAARVLGGLLTWLQERRRPVFVVATANTIHHLPPELLRRGRLDEVFFVDLPGAEARRTIAQIHLDTAPARRLGAAPPLADPLDRLLDHAAAAEGFSGAEIEAAIIEARLEAFAARRPLCAADLEAALSATIPLSQARSEEISTLRAWARRAARQA